MQLSLLSMTILALASEAFPISSTSFLCNRTGTILMRVSDTLCTRHEKVTDGTQIAEGWKRGETGTDGTQIAEGWKRSQVITDGTQIAEGWKRHQEGADGTQIAQG